MNKNIMLLSLLLTCVSATAETLNVPVNLVTNERVGKSIGHITISESNYGLIFTPDLQDLPPGLHGFHVHENASCAPGMSDGKSIAALAAGGHLDPQNTGKHLGPYDPNGHLGDLPPIYVNNEGIAHNPVLAPKLKSIQQIRNHAIMIHSGGDNHSDKPTPLGGGGARIACAIVS